jgi:hypothetical protein
MIRTCARLAGASAAVFALLLVAAQAGDTATAPGLGYDLGWWTVDGGGVVGLGGSGYGLGVAGRRLYAHRRLLGRREGE